jgi:hypothetical protein
MQTAEDPWLERCEVVGVWAAVAGEDYDRVETCDMLMLGCLGGHSFLPTKDLTRTCRS